MVDLDRRKLIQGTAGMALAATPFSLLADETYNVSYGVGPNLVDHVRRYNVVYRTLGPELGKDLVIEQMPNGSFALVYQRQGSRQSSLSIAKEHGKLLADIDTWIIKDGYPVVYTERDFLGLDTPTERKIVQTEQESSEEMNGLEQDIEQYIKGLRRRGMLRTTERTAWSVYDFETQEKLVTINEDVPMQAASMIKPFSALAFFTVAAQGKKSYGPKTRANMDQMMRVSSNPATRYIMDRVGGVGAVQQILKNEYPEIFQQTSIVETIPNNGRTYRNRASAHDYGRFLHALWLNELPYSRELHRLMAAGKSRITKGLPVGTKKYNKTGTTAKLCGDMGVIAPRTKSGGRVAYTLVGIIEDDTRGSGSTLQRSNVIAGVSQLVYAEMKKRHNLV